MSDFIRRLGERLGELALVALVATTPIAMSAVMNRGFEIAKLSVAEPLAFLALGAAIVACKRRVWDQWRVTCPLPSLMLATFLVVGLLSALASEMPSVAFFGGYYRREGLLAWLTYAAVFFAVVSVMRSAKRWDTMVDAMIITSVVPCLYAVMQRYDLDFYVVATSYAGRPSGTLGNPIFLAAYLSLLIPLTTARCVQARGHIAETCLWALLALMQVVVLVGTQTRGPLLALFGGLTLFAVCHAARARGRAFFVSFVAVPVAGIALVGALNALPTAARWAGDIPVISRLVFSLDAGASMSTTLASRSALTRLAIWQAGSETFAAAPFARKMLGYGPDSAYVHYFPHMSSIVMRTEGYWESNSFDRLHAEAFDLALNFGLIAWIAYALFFATVIFRAARALFGLTGVSSAWIFGACTLLGGVVGVAATFQLGIPSAAVPAFALGMGGGWFAYVFGCAWRMLRAARRPLELWDPAHWSLGVGLMCALLSFWMDAQINIPVLTTRLLAFAISALLLVICFREARSSAQIEDDSVTVSARPLDFLWVLGIVLTAACASFLAPIYDQTGSSPDGQWTHNWHLRLIPMIGVTIVGAYATWALSRARFNGPSGLPLRFVAAATVVAPPLIYGLIHYGLAVDIGTPPSMPTILRIALLSLAGPIYILLLCMVRGLLSIPPRASMSSRLNMSDWIYVLSVPLVVTAVGWTVMKSVVADVAATTAAWVESRQASLVEPLLILSVQAMPHERHYRRQWMQWPLAVAVAKIQRYDGSKAKYAEIERNLALAESRTRENMGLWPRDPWFVFALANTLQFRALRAFRSHDPEGGSKAAEQARGYFLRAHEMLPVQPLFLRNWAQFESEEGNAGDAADLLARMELIIPNELEPYAERIALARKFGDEDDIRATLARAKPNLPTNFYQKLVDLANLQR